MDFYQIKRKTINYYQILFKNNIRPDIIILFGFNAKGNSKKNSDVDLAVVSRDLGKNKIKEGTKLNKLL
ncbi:MAG: nucleotidyltransferase domain-containing protein [Pseudobdellovibrionaceae bacterium]